MTPSHPSSGSLTRVTWPGLEDNEAAAAAFSGGTAWMLGYLGGANDATALISADLDPDGLASPANVLLGLLDPVLLGNGFDTLRFQVLGNDVSLFDQTFLDATAALAFFDDQVLDLGPIGAGPDGLLDLRMQLDLTGANRADGLLLQRRRR